MSTNPNLEKQESVEEVQSFLFLRRMCGIIFEPVKTMQDVVQKPTFLWPILVLLIFGLCQSIFILPAVVNLSLDSIADSSKQVSNPLEVRNFVITTTKVVTLLSGTFGPLLLSYILAFGLWMLGKFYNKADFKSLVSVSLFAIMPKVIIGGVISTILIVISNGAALKKPATSLAVFLPTKVSGGFLYAFLNSIDIFAIWSLVLVSIGGALAMNTTTRRVLIPVLSLWLAILLVVSGLAGMAGV